MRPRGLQRSSVALHCGTPPPPASLPPLPKAPPPSSTHPAGLHLHVPFGSDHVVFVGGHGDAGSGTEAGVAGSQRSVEGERSD